VFFDPRGGTHFEGRRKGPEELLSQGPNPLPVTRASDDGGKTLVAALVEENQRRGVRPDGWTAGARWERAADIPDRVYFRAVEALHGAGP